MKNDSGVIPVQLIVGLFHLSKLVVKSKKLTTHLHVAPVARMQQS